MTSTSVTTVGGVVVVTQVFPKDEDAAVPMESPAPEEPKATPTPPVAAVAVTETPPPSPTKVDEMTAMFQRGEPKNLGVVQIFIGLLFIVFSLTSIYTWKLILYSAFSLAVAFVVSGSIAVAAGRRPSVSMVWACLLSHLLSASLALAGVLYLSWLMAVDQPSLSLCDPRDFARFPEADSLVERCNGSLWVLWRTLLGLLILFLVLMVLQLCVAVTVVVYSARAARLRGRYSPLQADDQRNLLSCPSSP